MVALAFDFEWFMDQVRTATGLDLTQYKRAQMERRLAALCAKRGFHSYGTYMQAVLERPELMAELLDRTTINVSEFYRNPARWETLRTDIMPRLIQNGQLHAWSAACSTGQEPYTLLLLLAEIMPLEGVQVLATDIDDRALHSARLGVFASDALIPIPQVMRSRYFQPVDADHWRIDPRLQERVQLVRHDLLADPCHKTFDLIVCRNVLIYFTESAKSVVFRKLAAALRPGGVLFLGATEQIHNPAAYELTQIAPFFYRRND